jgi:NAD(P)-dependent dehydrogenase (short-subunit alcohol dehydrogenase family)
MLSCTYDEWQKNVNETMQINLMGPANLTYFISRHMVEMGGGKIISVSSRGAFRGEPMAPAYGGSKAAVNQFNQSLARLLAPKKVFVYVVAPGFVETEMAALALKGPEGDEIRSQSPLNRVAKPEEVAHTILLLASEQTDFLTGGIIDINGASYLRS